MDPCTLNLDPQSVATKNHQPHQGNFAGAFVRAVLRYGCLKRNSPVHVASSWWRMRLTPPGAEYKGKKAGALGDVGVFSFHQQKNMVTLGEGGMVTTSSKRYVLSSMLSHPIALLPHLRSQGQVSCRLTKPGHPMGKRYWYLDFRRNRLQLSHDGRAGCRGLWPVPQA